MTPPSTTHLPRIGWLIAAVLVIILAGGTTGASLAGTDLAVSVPAAPPDTTITTSPAPPRAPSAEVEPRSTRGTSIIAGVVAIVVIAVGGLTCRWLTNRDAQPPCPRPQPDLDVKPPATAEPGERS